MQVAKNGVEMPFCNPEQCFGTSEHFFAPMVGAKMGCHFNN